MKSFISILFLLLSIIGFSQEYSVGNFYILEESLFDEDNLPLFTYNDELVELDGRIMYIKKEGVLELLSIENNSILKTAFISVDENQIYSLSPQIATVEFESTLTMDINADAAFTVNEWRLWRDNNDVVISADDKSAELSFIGGSDLYNYVVASIIDYKKDTVVLISRVVTEPQLVSTDPDKSQIVIDEGDSLDFGRIELGSENPPYNASDGPTWGSGDYSIVDVSEEGILTAVGPGTTNVWYLNSDNEKVFYDVQVNDSKAVPVGTLYITEASATVDLYKTKKFTYVSGGKVGTLKWFSDDNSIAAINQDGVVTAVGPGSTKVRVKSLEYPSLNRSALVIVNTKSPEDIIIEEEVLQLKETETYSLSYEILPADAYDKTVQWEVADENILEITSNGKIIAKSLGETKVYISSVISPSVIDSVAVKIVEDPAINHFYALGVDYYSSVLIDKFQFASYHIEGENITVDDDNLVKAVSLGVSKILLFDKENELKARLYISVSDDYVAGDESEPIYSIFKDDKNVTLYFDYRLFANQDFESKISLSHVKSSGNEIAIESISVDEDFPNRLIIELSREIEVGDEVLLTNTGAIYSADGRPIEFEYSMYIYVVGNDYFETPRVAVDGNVLSVFGGEWCEKLKIININGVTVLQDNLESSTTIDISSLPQGLYFASFFNEGQKAVVKFVKK